MLTLSRTSVACFHSESKAKDTATLTTGCDGSEARHEHATGERDAVKHDCGFYKAEWGEEIVTLRRPPSKTESRGAKRLCEEAMRRRSPAGAAECSLITLPPEPGENRYASQDDQQSIERIAPVGAEGVVEKRGRYGDEHSGYHRIT